MQGKTLKRKQSKDKSRLKSRQEFAKRVPQAPIKPEEVLETCTPLVPGRVGSDFSFLELADEVEPNVVFNILKG